MRGMNVIWEQMAFLLTSTGRERTIAACRWRYLKGDLSVYGLVPCATRMIQWLSIPELSSSLPIISDTDASSCHDAQLTAQAWSFLVSPSPFPFQLFRCHEVGYSSFPLLMTCPKNIDCLFLMWVPVLFVSWSNTIDQIFINLSSVHGVFILLWNKISAALTLFQK